MKTRDLVHKLKYDGGDCISEHLRVLFPELHSSFCDEGVNDIWSFMAQTVEVDQTGDC